MKYPLYIGCTKARHERLGIVAVINARGGLQHLNDLTQDDIELQRDAQAIKAGLSDRVRFYSVHSKFFRRHVGRIAHLMSSYHED